MMVKICFYRDLRLAVKHVQCHVIDSTLLAVTTDNYIHYVILKFNPWKPTKPKLLLIVAICW